MPEPEQKSSPARDQTWSARMHAAKAAKRAAEAAAGISPTTGAPNGSVEPAVERDRALALKTARAIARDTDARDADRLTAAALLARIEEAQAAGKPPSVAALQGLDESDLEALVLAHL